MASAIERRCACGVRRVRGQARGQARRRPSAQAKDGAREHAVQTYGFRTHGSRARGKSRVTVRAKAAQRTSAVTTTQHARHEGVGRPGAAACKTLKGRECVACVAGARAEKVLSDGWEIHLQHGDDVRALSKAALQARRPVPASVRAQMLLLEVPQPTNAHHGVRHWCGSSIVARAARARICTRRQGRDCGSPGLSGESRPSRLGGLERGHSNGRTGATMKLIVSS